MKTGKIIVLEGVDGSGKTTQFNLVKDFLLQQGYVVEHLHYPRHGTEYFGQKVDDYLNGSFGPADTVHPYFASLLYALDRMESMKQIRTWLDDGKIVLLDRYTSSNLGHQGGKIVDPIQRKDLFGEIDHVEYDVLGVIRPDAVIYLDVDFVHIQMMLNNREVGNDDKKYITKGTHDGHENDAHLQRAQIAYRHAAEYFNWYTIKCSQEGILLSKSEIQQMIQQVVISILAE